MNRNGITFEEVAQAAEALQAQGDNPTIDRVRAYLGGTGSNSTISKYLNRWRGQLQKADSAAEGASPSDPVQMAVKRVWQQIREETDAEIQLIQSETQAQLDEAEKEMRLLTKEAEELRVAGQALQQQVYALEAHKEILLLDFKKLEAEHAQLQERYQGLDARYLDFQNLTAQHQMDIAEAHKKEIRYLTEKAEVQEKATQERIADLKISMQTEQERDRSELEKLRTGNDDLEKQVAFLQSSQINRDLELRELKTQLAAVINERDRLATQITGQEQYWALFEKNSFLTKEIWSEVKELPKIDLNWSYLPIFSEIQNSIASSMEKLGTVTNEAKRTLEFFKKGNLLNTHDE